MKILDPKESFIIWNRFGFGGKCQTLEQVAKSLGVTRERIRQLQNIALSKLKRAVKAQDLENQMEEQDWVESIIIENCRDMDMGEFSINIKKQRKTDKPKAKIKRIEKKETERSLIDEAKERERKIQIEENNRFTSELEARIEPEIWCPHCKGRIANLFAIWERADGRIMREAICLSCRRIYALKISGAFAGGYLSSEQEMQIASRA